MSEQFYNYISNTIVSYLKGINLEGGERFNLYIEDEESVFSLYTNLKGLFSEQTTGFEYKHDKGINVFNSYSIKISDSHDVIIVASGNDVREDFITTLRNEIAKQEGIFKNKSLLILFSGKLDSLIGGSDSLLKKGMPLNTVEFSAKISQSIEKSESLKKYEKTILKYQLNKVINQSKIDNQSIFDYEGIVSSIHQGEINEESYPIIGMFSHEELKTITGDKELKLNIEANNQLFEKIEFIFNHGDSTLDLDSIVSESGVRELNKAENWRGIDYSKIIKWQDELTSHSPIEFIGEAPFDCDPSTITIFGRPDGVGIKKRRQNIMVFNPMQVYPISLSLKFNKRVTKDSIKIEKDSKGLEYETHGRQINIELYNEKSNYYWLQYQDNSSKRLFKFRILVFNFSSDYLDTIKRHYTINQDFPHPIELHKADKFFIFNKGADKKTEEETLEPNIELELNSSKSIELNLKEDYEDDIIPFKIKIENLDPLVFHLKNERPALQPISGLKIWKLKRERNKSFKYSKQLIKDKEIIKVISDNEEYTISGNLRHKLDWEKDIIDSDGCSWKLDVSGKIKTVELNKLDKDLKNSYLKLLQLYRESNLLPSLTPMAGDILIYSKQFIQVYNNHLEGLTNDLAVTDELNELFLLGLLCEEDGHKDIHLSPLHPLMIAYQITLNEEIKDEELYNAILSKLTPLNLLPYISWKENTIYSPTEDSSVPEWIKYNNKKEFKKGISKEFVRKLVHDKLNEFNKHFSYLFITPESPIIINVFNMGDCKEILQGLFDYYQKMLLNDRDLESLPTLDVNIYGSDRWVTKFEELTFYQNAKELNDKDEDLNLKINKSSKYDADDLLNVFRQNVHFYNKTLNNINYAHISFYHFDQMKIAYDDNIMNTVPSGMAVDALFSDLTSSYNNNSYRTGFSSGGLKDNKSLLEKVAISINSIGRVLFSNKLYEKSKSICSIVDYNVKESLNDIYKKSQWVTFIEPKVGLNFFKENEKVIIIHYSDQYNNTSGYDAITVTKKTTQYRYIIEEFLKSKEINVTSEDTSRVINLFNSINGDWLLKMISQRNENYKNEKLSLLSASKLSLALFKHKDIVWIPTSLEEILRVSGNAGLKQKDSVFSAKNLGKTGVHSDDILLIGLKQTDDKLEMVLYPIEVKIGKNPNEVIKKAKEQVSNTSQLLYEAFDPEKSGEFKIKLYKNFFAKLALITAEKLLLYNVSESNSKNWTLVLDKYRNDLLNNNFKLASYQKCIGKGGVIAFGGSYTRKVKIEDNIMLFNFLENDGYEFLLMEDSELFNRFVDGSKSSINTDLLLWNCLDIENEEEVNLKSEEVTINNEKSDTEKTNNSVKTLNKLKTKELWHILNKEILNFMA